MKLYSALVAEGFNVSVDNFMDAYSRAHEKYRLIRYGELREVTNAIWIAEALNELGYDDVKSDDVRLKTALNVFFKDFADALRLRAGAVELFTQVSSSFLSCRKIGLLSNFTYAPIIHFSLNKLGISKYFNAILTSDENGWRKPSLHIFSDILSRLHVAGDEVVYVGDSPLEDIKGAKAAGCTTVFVCSQFNSIEQLASCNVTADFTAKNLCEVSEIFSQLIK
jgi:FMN phosphatase YigB (HAD superfamily)